MFDSANTMDWYNKRKNKEMESAQLFQMETASIDGRAVQCTGGVALTPAKALDEIGQTDLIIVPGFMFNILPVLHTLQPICDWLKVKAAEGAQVASICTGAFVVAEAGLLDGRQATTHWMFLRQFQRRYPQACIKEEYTVTDDRGVYCSGGASSAIDLLIYLIRCFGSPELASECSRKLLVDTSRRSQMPYVQYNFKRNHEDQDILRVQDWLEENYHQDIVFDDVASTFNFGVRNFIRRFKSATGETPNQYLQNLRVEQAKYLLETTKTSFDQITYQIGYEDSNSFRRLFKTRVGIGPTDYRKKFQL
jgi:transcriptional regulator GlxA family with amidase domain